MSRDGVDTPPPPQVPHFTCVVTAPSSHVKTASYTLTLFFLKCFKIRIFEQDWNLFLFFLPIWGEIDGVNFFKMTLQEHDTATGPQVPHAAEWIQTTKRAVFKGIKWRIKVTAVLLLSLTRYLHKQNWSSSVHVAGKYREIWCIHNITSQSYSRVNQKLSSFWLY